MTKPWNAAALLLALCAVSAQAQTIYRCGESYGTQPCPGGTVVPTDDARSAAQRAQTDAATKRDARSALALEKERLRQEGKPAPSIVLAPPAADAPATDRKDPMAKPRKPEIFTAVAPRKPGDAPAKKKKKAAKPAA